MEHINYWAGLLKDFQADFKRILDEIPERVEERHLETLRQIHGKSNYENRQTRITFGEMISDKLSRNKILESLANRVLALAWQRFVDNEPLDALSSRLRAFVGSRGGRRPKTKGIEPLDVPQSLLWGNVHMMFYDKEHVEIRAGGKPLGLRSFAVLGFENKKNKSPDIIWDTLLLLGKHDGEITWKTKDGSGEITAKLKKRISILRKRLKNLFGISEDPFCPYTKKGGYKAKFRVSVRNEEI
jgi:hypothetical protein